MKRYKIQTSYNLNCNATMIESDGGEWVRYTDYAKEKEESDRKLNEVNGKLEETSRILNNVILRIQNFSIKTI